MDWTTLVAVGILIVVLIWGPQKIPEVARSLGRARREFEEASRGISDPSRSLRMRDAPSDSLIEIAQKLGIATQGKTKQEISDEIVRTARSK
jgi:sec-independent protein translocase protein TatA